MRKDLILAIGYLEAGLDVAAAEAAGAVLAADPGDADARFVRGCALERLDRLAEAVPDLEAAAAARPGDAAVRHACGLALYRHGRAADALAHLEAAARAEARVDFAETLGTCLMTLLRPDDAEPHLRRVAEARAGNVTAWANLAACLVDLNRCEEARDACARALALAPDDVEAHMSRAFANLLAGDWRTAWPEYEWRWKRKAFVDAYPPSGLPRWRGEPLSAGGRLWVRGEQGLGDHIQFARFVGRAAAAAGVPAVVSAPPVLHRLLGAVDGVAGVFATANAPPGCVAEIPMMSLPGVLALAPDGDFGRFPYLSAPATPCLPEVPGRFRVGVVWGDKPKPRSRSIDPALIAAALDGLGLAVYSLQADSRACDIPRDSGWIDLAPLIRDFADTAALIAQMDAVVSVDTAALHVAGGLGVPVYVLLVKGADWRWMRDRADTPWYPSARLLRQETAHDWSVPLARLRAALSPGSSTARAG